MEEKRRLKGMFEVSKLDRVFREYMGLDNVTEVKVIELDEIDFFNKKHVEEKQEEHYENIIVSKVAREIYVSQEAYRKEPFIAITAVFDELFPFYEEQIPFIAQADAMQQKFFRMQSVMNGAEIWKTFSSLFCITSIMRDYFSEYDSIEGYEKNPYNPEENKKQTIEILSKIEEERISADHPAVLLCFSRILVYEHEIDFSDYLSAGEKYQKLYDRLKDAVEKELNMFLIYKIGRAYKPFISKESKNGSSDKKQKEKKPVKNKPKQCH